jgi:hypothetical protein
MKTRGRNQRVLRRDHPRLPLPERAAVLLKHDSLPGDHDLVRVTFPVRPIWIIMLSPFFVA